MDSTSCKSSFLLRRVERRKQRSKIELRSLVLRLAGSIEVACDRLCLVSAFPASFWPSLAARSLEFGIIYLEMKSDSSRFRRRRAGMGCVATSGSSLASETMGISQWSDVARSEQFRESWRGMKEVELGESEGQQSGMLDKRVIAEDFADVSRISLIPVPPKSSGDGQRRSSSDVFDPSGHDGLACTSRTRTSRTQTVDGNAQRRKSIMARSRRR